jgi:tetraacyldisaccharide 4'-kinase
MSLSRRIEAAWTAGGPLQWALRPLGALMAVLVALRHALFRSGWLRSDAAPVPVVVVGNRLVGGAGKTPVTLALVQALRAAGWRPAIVSRGHGARATAPRPVEPGASAADVGDEPLLLHRRSGVPVWVGRDRVAVAQALCAAHPQVDVLVCDDGLQHLRLRRDLEIVVFDARGAGNGWLLPAGPLREPIDVRSDVPRLVLYNAAAPSTALPGECIRPVLDGLVPLADWWQGAPAQPGAVAALQALARAEARTAPPALLASAGIGQPQRFFDHLLALGLDATPWPLPDHFDYATLPWPASARTLVVTEKDAIKLRPERLARERPGLQVWVAPLTLTLPERVTQAVRAHLGAGAAPRPQPTPLFNR